MNSINYWGIFYLTLLVIPTLLINRQLGINLSRQTMISISRMIIQLSLVGIYLQYIFDLNNPLLNICYTLIVMMVATISITNTTGLRKKELYLPIFISISFFPLFAILFFNAFVIKLDNIFDARYIITIGGMLMGNVLRGNIIGLTTYYRGI